MWPNPNIPFLTPLMFLRVVWEELTGNTVADRIRRRQEKEGLMAKDFAFHKGGYDVYDDQGALVHRKVPLGRAARTAGLDPHEVEWAHEQEGRADSDTHAILPHGTKYTPRVLKQAKMKDPTKKDLDRLDRAYRKKGK